jgi:hypothetical protein
MINKTACGIVCFALASASIAGVCMADDCKPVNREASISKVLSDHSGGKVLKVDERKDDNGCTELEIRILIDGTVKAIVVSGQKSA